MRTAPCSVACTADVPTTAPAALRRRRALRVTATSARAAARPPVGDGRRHGTRTAARLLTAAGVRVRVLPPPTPWPAGARLLVTNRVSWVEDLAVRTAVPVLPDDDAATWPGLATVPGPDVAAHLARGRSVLVRPEADAGCGAELGRFRPESVRPAVEAEVPVCPVAVRARLAGRATTATAREPGGSWWRGSGWRAAARVLGCTDLVVEVHLLAAIDPRRGTPEEVAALAEYAVAAVLEADPPQLPGHPRRPRTHASGLSPRTPARH